MFCSVQTSLPLHILRSIAAPYRHRGEERERFGNHSWDISFQMVELMRYGAWTSANAFVRKDLLLLDRKLASQSYSRYRSRLISVISSRCLAATEADTCARRAMGLRKNNNALAIIVCRPLIPVCCSFLHPGFCTGSSTSLENSTMRLPCARE